MFNWFISLSATDKIAIFALLVAFYGAVLSTVLYKKETLKLNIHYLNKSYLTLSEIANYRSYDEIGIEYLGYDPKLYTVAIFVRIINKSKNPTTIYSFTLNKKYVFDSSSDIHSSLIPIAFSKSDNILVACNFETVEKDFQRIQPLLELKPLSAIEGCLVFTGLPSKPKKFKIKVKAVQKNKSFSFKFKISKDYSNEIS